MDDKMINFLLIDNFFFLKKLYFNKQQTIQQFVNTSHHISKNNLDCLQMQKPAATDQKQHIVVQTDKVERKVTKQGKYINQYLKVKTIGEGPFSKIKLYIDCIKNKKVAIKKYNLFILKKKKKAQHTPQGSVIYTSQADEVRRQIQIMKVPNHPNVAKVYQIIEDHQQQKIYIIMDYCSHGDIANWNHKKSRFQLKKQFSKSFQFFKDKFLQTAKGLEYLHKMNIVHRDIKPLNILVDENGVVKIIDFGSSVRLKDQKQKLKGSEGTYHFMAPQQLSEIYPQGYDGKKCDIWSLGISFYGILFGELPFYHQLLIKLFDMIQSGKFSFPTKYEKYCQPFKPLIVKMLQVDPEKRCTAKEVVEEIVKLKQ